MINLKYTQNMTKQQINQLFLQKTKQQNLTKSQFYFQSYIHHPYHFQEQYRKTYIKKQEKQLKQLQLLSIPTKFILVRKTKNFHSTDHPNIQKTWIININTLQIIKTIPDSITPHQLSQLQQQYPHLPTQPLHPTKYSNILFFGRTEFQGRSIYIDNDTRVSNKHMLLIKQPNVNKNTLLFLLCMKKLLYRPSDTQLSLPFAQLNNDNIRKIVAFLGKINQNIYSLVDNSSNNGTFFYPNGNLVLTNQVKQHLIISKEYGFYLKLKAILTKTNPSNITSTINTFLSQSIKPHQTPIPILNRNLPLQSLHQTTNESLSVLILTSKTPRINKLYILYNVESPYSVIKHQQDIDISVNAPQRQEIVYGKIKWEDDKWQLQTKDIYFQFKNNVHYKIKKQAYISLGSTTKLIITINPNIIQ